MSQLWSWCDVPSFNRKLWTALQFPYAIWNFQSIITCTQKLLFIYWFVKTAGVCAHLVRFQILPSKSSQCGRHCRKLVSVLLHQRTNSRLWRCVPSKWPGTPSRHPLLCKCRCCCHSWLKPGAVETRGKHTVVQQSVHQQWRAIYLLRRMPHNVLDVLCVRVDDSNTLVLIFFVHCETHTKGKLGYYCRLLGSIPWHTVVEAYLPTPRHSCLGCMLLADSLKGPRPHIWPHFHVLPTQSNSRRQRPFAAKTGPVTRNNKTVVLLLPQSHCSFFSRCTWLHQSWRRPDNSHRETTPPSSQCAGVHPVGHSYIPKSHLNGKDC